MSQLLYALVIHLDLLDVSLLDIFELYVFICHSKSFDDSYKTLVLAQKKYSQEILTCNYGTNLMPSFSMYTECIDHVFFRFFSFVFTTTLNTFT
jgi:hypothetical protein